MGRMNRWPSVWCSHYYLFSWFLAEFFAKILSIYLFIFWKKYKNKCKRKILGTSDAWSTIHLSSRPGDPAWIYLRLMDFLRRQQKFCFSLNFLKLSGNISHLCYYLIGGFLVKTSLQLTFAIKLSRLKKVIFGTSFLFLNQEFSPHWFVSTR